MTTPNTPTPDTDCLLRAIDAFGKDARTELVKHVRRLEQERTQARGALVVALANREDLERELAEARQANLDLSTEVDMHEAHYETMQSERDAARAGEQRWWECAEAYRNVLLPGFAGNRDESLSRADRLYQLCHSSPTPSSPPSPPIATASPAPETATASRLQALESALALQQRKTQYLLAQLFNLNQAYWEQNGTFLLALSKTEWPADLALTESTSTSQPTEKPSPSGEGSCA